MDGEAAKYTEVWKHEAYRQVAPGVRYVNQFIELAKPGRDCVLGDFGCGTGRGAATIASLTDMAVVGIDFAENCLDREVREQLGERFRFLRHDLTTELKEKFDYGYCTDVLEHIPPENVDVTIRNIITAARKVFFVIALFPHEAFGEKLHLTVESPFWWHDKLKSLGFRIDHSSYNEYHAMFYGSAYANANDIAERSELNIEEERIAKNIKENLSLGLKEVCPHEEQFQTVYLLAGGPSLADYEQQIVEAGKSGTPIITMNGTYNWLIERGIKPAAQIMVDAREFNKRFVDPVIDTCTYLISSQCDHEILKSLPVEKTWLWHPAASEVAKYILDEDDGKSHYAVIGGTTVATCSLSLLMLLGFRKIEVFGLDSCLREDKHHAYSQPENDSSTVLDIKVGNRWFKCHGWMVIQANDVQKLIKHVFSKIDNFELAVHGDGLIAHMINTAAELAAIEE